MSIPKPTPHLLSIAALIIAGASVSVISGSTAPGVFALLGAGMVLIFARILPGRQMDKVAARNADLCRTEKMFEAACKTLKTAMFVVQGESLVFWNPVAREILGRTDGEMSDFRFWDIVRPDYRDMVKSRGLGRLAGEDVPSSYEMPVLRKDGGVRWIYFSASRFLLDGESSIFGTALDITELKEAQSSLEAMVEFERAVSMVFGEFVNSGPDSIKEAVENTLGNLGKMLGADVAGTCTFKSSVEGNQIWYSAGNGSDGSHPISSCCDLPWLDEVIRNGQPIVIDDIEELGEIDRLRMGGVETGAVLSVPMIEDGKVVGTISFLKGEPMPWAAWNLSIAKVAAEVICSALAKADTQVALRRSEEQYRNLYDDAPSLCFTIDGKGMVVSVNQFGATRLNRSPQEIVGMPVVELIHAEQRTDFAETVRSVLRGGGATAQKMYRFDIGEEELWVRMSLRPIVSRAGTTIYVNGLDVTEVKFMERQRRKIEAQFEYTQKMESIGLLASVIAHEFNNQLMVVSGNADLALLDLPGDSDARKALEEIKGTVDSAGTMTKQLLAYAGKGQADLGLVSASSVVRKMERLIRVAFADKAMLELDLSENLPGIEMQGAQFRQIVMNLVTNAVSALHGEPGRIRVATSMCEYSAEQLSEAILQGEAVPGPYVVLEVTDTGPGIDETIRERMFEPFFTATQDGRGLGLFVVAEIVKAMAGAIIVESSAEVGTMFRVLFPASGEGERREGSPGKAIGFRPLGGQDRRVLVVDDNDAVRGVTVRMIRSAGYDVVAASGGRDALASIHASEEPFDVVVLDLTMADWSGVETMTNIRKSCPDTRVVLVSGYSEEIIGDLFREHAPDGFLQKPYHASILLELLESVLGAAAPASQGPLNSP